MISSQTRHYLAGFDEIVRESDEDFEQSGLKVTSVIQAGRLAVVAGDILLGEPPVPPSGPVVGDRGWLADSNPHWIARSTPALDPTPNCARIG